MSSMKVVIEVRQEVWDKIPEVARYLQLSSDVPSPATIQTILEYAITELLMESGSIPQTTDQPTQEALDALLDPNIAIPLKELTDWADRSPSNRKSLLEEFQDLTLQIPDDQWILKVLAQPEDQVPTWKAALAAVYSVVSGSERKSIATWGLIERTYGMLKSVDKSNGQADNTGSS